MLLLIFISVTGFVLSTVIHFCWLFHIYEPPRELTIFIWMGVMVVIYPALIISKKTRGELTEKDFRKAISGVCPRWLLIMNRLVIMYALGWLIFCIYKKYFADSSDFRGFTGHWMLFYSISFKLLYCCKRLKKQT